MKVVPTTNSSPEDFAWRPEVVWPSNRVSVHALTQKIQIFHYNISIDRQIFTSHTSTVKHQNINDWNYWKGQEFMFNSMCMTTYTTLPIN